MGSRGSWVWFMAALLACAMACAPKKTPPTVAAAPAPSPVPSPTTAAAVAGAWRSSDAVPALAAAIRVPTAALLPNDPTFDEEKRAAVAALVGDEIAAVADVEKADSVELERLRHAV